MFIKLTGQTSAKTKGETTDSSRLESYGVKWSQVESSQQENSGLH